MQAPIGVYWDIVLLRGGPRDLPASWALLMATGGSYFAINFVIAASGYGAVQGLARAIVDLALTVGVFSAVLAVRRQGHRLLQTLTALLGTGALLSLPMLPLALYAGGAGEGHAVLALLVVVPLLAWNLLVIGHIVRVALEVPLLNGVAVAMSFTILCVLIGERWPAPVAS